MIEKSIHCLVLGHHDITMNVQKTEEDTQGAMNNVHIRRQLAHKKQRLIFPLRNAISLRFLFVLCRFALYPANLFQ